MFGKYKKLYFDAISEVRVSRESIDSLNSTVAFYRSENARLESKLAESEEKRKASAGLVADLEAELGRFQSAASESQKKAVDKKRTAAKGEKGK